MSEQGYTNQENRESPRITLNTYPSGPKKTFKMGNIKSHTSLTEFSNLVKIPNLQMPILNDQCIFNLDNYKIIASHQKNGIFKNINIVQDKKTKKQYSAKTVSTAIDPTKESFISELNKLLSIKHSTLLNLQGYSFKDFEGGNNFTIFTEIFENISLFDAIVNDKKLHISRFNNTIKQEILIGVARAMMILHQNHIIHRKLNSFNILIDTDFKPHISDYGLAKIFNCSNDHLIYGPHSWAYIAPEVISSQCYSFKSDVYSYGILMYEIVTGNLAYQEIEDEKNDESILMQNVVHGQRPNFNVKIKEEFKELIEACLSHVSTKRPSFKYIFNKLVSNKCCLDDVNSNELSRFIDKVSIEMESNEKTSFSQKATNRKEDNQSGNMLKKFDMTAKKSRTSNIDKMREDKQIEISSQSFEATEKLKLTNQIKKLQVENSKLKRFIVQSEKSISNSSENDEINDEIKCISCNNHFVSSKDIICYSGFLYHKKCLKCSICHKRINSHNDFDNFICVTPGMFFCRDDYEEYQNTKKLPVNVLVDYINKMVTNSIIEIFDPIFLENYVMDAKMIKNENEKEFIYPEMIENSFQFNENYKYFVPTVTFHFELPPNKIDILKILNIILPKNMIIVNYAEGSTFLTIAFIFTDEFIEEPQYKEIVDSIKAELSSLNGNTIVGNIINEPKINIPTDDDIKEFYEKKSVNILQNLAVLDQIDFYEIKKEVHQKLEKFKNLNYKFIYKNFNVFAKAEKNAREDIINNEIELVITGVTIISNVHYMKIKRIRKFLKDKACECFLYHGTNLKNHYGIINDHFLMPDENPNIRDYGYFGRGLYATDNIYYASMYIHNFEHLSNYEKAPILCCCAIYNTDYEVKISPKDQEKYKGKPLDDEVVDNYGVHSTVVGSNCQYLPFDHNSTDPDSLLIKPKEYVFGNEFQLVPVCSLTVMKTDFYVLWVDEQKKHSKILDLLKKKVIENVYYINEEEKIYDLVKLKIRNKVKLILSFENDDWAKRVLQKIRSIYHHFDFVCLIFSEEIEHIKFAHKFQNVLFTDKPRYLLQFANIELKSNCINKYIEILENKYQMRFNINNEKLLRFYKKTNMIASFQ